MAEDRYAVSFQCTPPVEKGIYHGSRAWSLSIIPLHGVEALPEAKEKEIEAGLGSPDLKESAVTVLSRDA